MDAALNHWVFDPGEQSFGDLAAHAAEVVKHMREAHTEASLVVFQERGEPASKRVHFVLESINTRAQRQFIESYGQDSVCRALVQHEDLAFKLQEDVYLRLIASDPEKEKKLTSFKRVIMWCLDTRFPRAAQAVECAGKLVQHLSSTYPELAFRAYDEWFPHSGNVRIYVLDPHEDYVAWEGIEARIRHDPVVRELLEGAADAFVDDSFRDTWLTVLAP